MGETAELGGGDGYWNTGEVEVAASGRYEGNQTGEEDSNTGVDKGGKTQQGRKND